MIPDSLITLEYLTPPSFCTSSYVRELIGQEIIRISYQWSPVIVKAMKEDEELKQVIKKLIDSVLPLIKKWVE